MHWDKHLRLRPMKASEVDVLRARWFFGATIVAYATPSRMGLATVDAAGSIPCDLVIAAVEIPLAGFWNVQGKILLSPWTGQAHETFRWSHVERASDGVSFVLFDSADRASRPMAPGMVAMVVAHVPCVSRPSLPHPPVPSASRR